MMNFETFGTNKGSFTLGFGLSSSKAQFAINVQKKLHVGLKSLIQGSELIFQNGCFPKNP